MAPETEAKKTVTKRKTAPVLTDLDETALVVATENGTTRIQPHVVAKIAGLAIREVAGVHSLVPYNAGQTLNNLANTLTGGDLRELGVKVEVGKIEAAVDCRIVTEFGVAIPEVAQAIRDNVSERIGQMTGLKVKETNIEVVDLHFHEDDEPVAQTTRVQ